MASIINHEVGHLLGLTHPFQGSSNCSDTPINSTSNAGNNLMDYGQQIALTPCQIAIAQNTLTSYYTGYFNCQPCRTPAAVSVAGNGPEPCPDNSEYFSIQNFNTSLTYTITGNRISALPGKLGFGTNSPNASTFRMKGGAGVTGGSFTIAAADPCNGITVQGPSSSYYATFAGACNGSSVVSTRSVDRQFVLYPNPGTTSVYMESNNLSGRDVEAVSITAVRVYDTYGQLRLEQMSNNKKPVLLQTGKLPVGVYIVHIMQGDRILSREKLQIQ